ncbi:jg26883 [Pararge aegeria aegeria]|uniref:Jg26883 protein n=1 Tax=Pararge aegeria aegeria TaxID=348720 RepID=A0A8S4SGE7_9NEOP|nr:jg26883 [Pararge aegeria aegeria]
MCSVKGYAHKFEIYTGQENERLPDEPDFGPVGNVVVRLARGVPRHINHIIYFDNFYTSVPLVTYLAKQGIYSLGTVQSNRLVNCKLPDKKTMMKKSVPRGTYEEQTTEFDGIDLTAVTWKDNKVVTFLSSYVGAEPVGQVERFDKANKTRIKILCPHIIKEYNALMGGVDLMDSFIGRLELAEVLAKVNNSFELCNKRGRPSTSNSVEMEIQAKKRRGPAQHIPP